MRLKNKSTQDVTVFVWVLDSSKSDGSGLAGLAHDTSGLVCSYARDGGARVAAALATQTVTGAHSDGGFVEIDATNMPGFYRLDLPDAVCAAGVEAVGVLLSGASNMAPIAIGIELREGLLIEVAQYYYRMMRTA